MLALLTELQQLLSSPAGTLTYNLVIAFAIIGALQVHWLGAGSAEDKRRVLFGLVGLLALRFLPFVLAMFASSGFDSLGLLVPVIDRGIFALSVLLIFWLWAFPQRARTPDVAALLVGLLIAVLTVFSAALWLSRGGGFYFANTPAGLFWSLFLLVMLGCSAILLYTRRQPGWVFGLFMLSTFFLGEALQVLFRGIESDFAIFSRLFQMAAFPLLFSLPAAARIGEATGDDLSDTHPIAVSKPESLPDTVSAEHDPGTPQPERAPAAAYLASLELATTHSVEHIARLVSMHTAYALIADICLLAAPPGMDGEISVYAGYDTSREEFLPRRTIPQSLIPGIGEAMRNARSLQIGTGKAANQLNDLARTLHLDSAGNLLAMPVTDASEEHNVIAMVILLSPYSRQVWKSDAQNLFREAAPRIAHLLATAQHAESQGADTEPSEQVAALQREKERLLDENQQLRAEIALVNTRLVDEPGDSTDQVADLQGRLQAAAETFDALNAENKDLKRSLESLQSVTNRSQDTTLAEKLAGELRLAMQQVADLQAELVRAEAVSGVTANGGGASEEHVELITSIAQDLRQPMASIVGYTDLLLSESVGILGALQRKFLDRIKASTDRMNRLVDDLMKMSTMDAGHVRLNPETVELINVLDVAIHETSALIREKSILLRVDVPDDIPRLQTDRDALQQVITNLLHNAGAATPANGEIVLRAETFSENAEEFVLVEIADSGEGIPHEDLSRVFSRLYRAENPFIQGVGDSGVGLSIVKTLTDALGGRIWVESEPAKGSTFKVMVPLQARLAPVVAEE